MKFLLDTGHISILQTESEPSFSVLSAKMRRHPSGDFAYSIISFHEQVIGAHAYTNRARRAEGLVKGYQILHKILRDFSSIAVATFDGPAASEHARLSSLGLGVKTMDLRIASIARSLQMILLTRNKIDFDKVPGLIHENWAA